MKIRILTCHGDYDVLVGKKWMRSFDVRWKAVIYRACLRAKMGFSELVSFFQGPR